MPSQVKNVFAFLYKTIVDIFIYTLILVTILAILPNSLFKNFPLEPNSYETNFTDKLEKWNNYLNSKSELLLNGQIPGPESMAEKNQFLYTGLTDGRVIEINKKTLKIRDVAKVGDGPTCDENSKCGRVLGMRFNRDGYLYAVDYYNGLYRINVSTGVNEIIPISNNEIKGYYDDLEFDPKLNMVYITVMTTKWSLDRCLYGLVEFDVTGYVFAYNFDTKTSVKLRTGMAFANGLQLSKDKKYLLVAETGRFKISKILITSLHKAIKENRLLNNNEIETFAELPGEPDNIRLDPNGDVLVGMFSVRNNGKTVSDYLSEWPIIRKAVGRMAYVFAISIDFLNSKLIGSKSLKILSLELYSGQSFANYIPKTGAVIKLDGKSGKIKQILGSEQYFGVTEAQVDSEGDLYFGSFISPFLGRIKKGNY